MSDQRLSGIYSEKFVGNKKQLGIYMLGENHCESDLVHLG